MLDSEIPEPPGGRRIGLRPVVLTGLAAVVAFFGCFGVWASFALLESAAIAPGIVVVESSRKTVQHFEGGIVGEILVGEGDAVRAGQPLIRLDQTRAKANLEQLRTAHRSAAALAARLAAERDGAEGIVFPAWLEQESADGRTAAVVASQRNVYAARLRAHHGQAAILAQQIAQSEEEITGLRGQIAAEDSQLKLLAEEIAGKDSLLAKGLIDKPQVLALKRRQAEIKGTRSRHVAAIARVRKTIGETRIRISELETLRVNQAVAELQEAERTLFEQEERLAAADDVFRRTVIRAPIKGTVVDLQVHTPGGVVRPGEALLHIVPSGERLLIDARISPNDVDVVAPGDAAHVRLTAFQQRHRAPLQGRLVSVSADHLVDERSGASYYLGRVELLAAPDRGAADNDNDDRLHPGMQAEVMILTGRNTLMSYLFEPLAQTIRRAFRET